MIELASLHVVTTIVARQDTAVTNGFYFSNRAPLVPSQFISRPIIGAVQPKGWLLEIMKRQRDGLCGNLGEISVWLQKEDNAWLSQDGKGKHGWEELPCWLKGYIQLAYIFKDPKMIVESQVWISGALNNQRPNGDFGPDQKFDDDQPSPAWSDQPKEKVTLISMGATPLRILALPTVTSNAGAHHWSPSLNTDTMNETIDATTAKRDFHEITVNGIVGFQDTPMEPDGQWHVHDPARTQPPVITPRASFSENAPPPGDAIVLFDGKDLSQWTDSQGHPAPWVVKDGAAITTATDIFTRQKFGDIQLHLEFREPTPATDSGQNRGNSGIFFMGRYEIQVLDCFDNKTYADGTTGAIYAQHPPLANACRPPGEWETYDILFTAPRRGADGKVTTPAYATVILNGVVVQNHQAFRGTTTHCAMGTYAPQGPTGPLGLQYHLDAVAFRNIWVRPVPLANEP